MRAADSGTKTLPSSAGGELAVHLHLPAVVRRAECRVAVLVHGFGSDAAANWVRSGWVRTLADAGVAVAAPDLPGHGSSSRPHRPAGYSLSGLLRDVLAVVEALPSWFGPVDAVDLVGYSLGARVVAEVAAARPGSSPAMPSQAGRPEIRRLVLGGYGGGPLLDGVDAESLGAALSGLPALAVLPVLPSSAGAGAPAPAGPGLDAATARIARIARMLPGGDPLALAALVQGLIDEGRVTASGPVPDQASLVVAGSLDPVAAAAAGWADLLPRGRFLQVMGRDHVNVVTSAEFRSAAVAFLTDPDEGRLPGDG